MEFYEVIRTRRSIRSYKPDSIPDELVNRVLEAARIAPSGSNRQPWKFIVIKDTDLKKRITTACGNQKSLDEAPIIIVACGYNIYSEQNKFYNRGGYMKDFSMLIDVSIALTHLILAARTEGLGTCWIGLFNNEEVKEILGVPKEVNVVAVTPLGYPKVGKFAEPGPRKNLKEILSVDKF
ncbi:MAG: hypothetical protein QG670_2070 [Thermoproteota archaeon]|nr:hypothetical protein [Thermoproteota archaeon]